MHFQFANNNLDGFFDWDTEVEMEKKNRIMWPNRNFSHRVTVENRMSTHSLFRRSRISYTPSAFSDIMIKRCRAAFEQNHMKMCCFLRHRILLFLRKISIIFIYWLKNSVCHGVRIIIKKWWKNTLIEHDFD